MMTTTAVTFAWTSKTTRIELRATVSQNNMVTVTATASGETLPEAMTTMLKNARAEAAANPTSRDREVVQALEALGGALLPRPVMEERR